MRLIQTSFIAQTARKLNILRACHPTHAQKYMFVAQNCHGADIKDKKLRSGRALAPVLQSQAVRVPQVRQVLQVLQGTYNPLPAHPSYPSRGPPLATLARRVQPTSILPHFHPPILCSDSYPTPTLSHERKIHTTQMPHAHMPAIWPRWRVSCRY